eukprot:11669437-Alexandrium_andersonii.AAC.1
MVACSLEAWSPRKRNLFCNKKKTACSDSSRISPRDGTSALARERGLRFAQPAQRQRPARTRAFSGAPERTHGARALRSGHLPERVSFCAA